MKIHRHRTHGHRERGVTMLEVLITIVILAFGLLGIAGLQARMQVAEIEAYQRTQAIVLLQDMVDRLNAAGKNVDYKNINVALGTDDTTQPPSPADCPGLGNAKDRDLCEWHHALLGASEKKGTQNLGAMIDARGCVENQVPAMPREFLVSVVWQGLAATAVPTTTTCGVPPYAADDATRRAIVARVKIGCLQNDPTTGLCITP